jgi:predicted DCC family thiol-disulfide oxidoreductase YuxK
LDFVSFSDGAPAFPVLITPMPSPQAPPNHLVLYDGVCALCDGTVGFLIQQDPNLILRFAPLQGSTATALLAEYHVDLQMRSIVFVDRENPGEPYGLYFRSDAILRIFKRLGGPWSLLALFGVVPRFLRDAAYEAIAGNRYRWFGKKESCSLPPPQARGRFLD